MNLRLFALRNTQTNKLVTSDYYTSKPAAKRARDQANKEAGQDIYVVSPGPDHRKAAKR